MSINVLIPEPLRKLADGKQVVTVSASTVGQMITELENSYRGIQVRLLDDSGQIRRFVLVFVNGEDIRFLKDQETPLKDGDEVSIVAAQAGG